MSSQKAGIPEDVDWNMLSTSSSISIDTLAELLTAQFVDENWNQFNISQGGLGLLSSCEDHPSFEYSPGSMKLNAAQEETGAKTVTSMAPFQLPLLHLPVVWPRCYDSTPKLFLSKSTDASAEDRYSENALQATSNQSKVVELPLSNDADINTQGGRYGDLLQATSAEG